MPFIQRDDMVQHLSATTSHPAFRSSILPGRSDARPLRFQTCRPQKCDDIIAELRVSIHDDVTIGSGLGKGFAQLLDDPVCARVSSDVAVHDLTPAVLDDEEA